MSLSFEQNADLLAIHQRSRGLDQQREQLAAAQRQATANAIAAARTAGIEQDRADLEGQRLVIEKQRLKAEESERRQVHLQAEQIKQLRSLMADTMDSLDRLKKLRPAP